MNPSRLVLMVESPSPARETNRELIEQVFLAKVVMLDDYVSALNFLQSIRPKVVVMDVSLNTPGALELAKIIKASPVTSHLPVVGLFAPAYYDETKLSSFDDFIKKPYQVEDLLARIGKHLKQAGPVGPLRSDATRVA